MHGSDVEPEWPIPAVFLLHGKGGSPEGTIKKLHIILEQRWPGLSFHRPLLPHHDPGVLCEISIEHLLDMDIPRHALLVGISLGGLVAAKLQEVGRDDLQVMAISSPTWADGLSLERSAQHRLAFYSSRDDVIASRTTNWPKIADFARDFEWLTHDSDRHLRQIARLCDWYLEGMLSDWIDRILNSSSTQQERDEIVWKSMAEAPQTTRNWRETPWSGERPQTFGEMGDVIKAGKDWEYAWSNWGHEFISRKDPRCLEEEPPLWFSKERRAMLAGVAEFFSHLYRLPMPSWIEKPEYFLLEPEYFTILMPDSEVGLYRMRARTPKEMLRRNVIFEARNMTLL
ncbi:alpha/beta hydrolase [Acidipila rosea]|uniref:Uncharacterized protein n=1 Tax=Acidipila rosea TaxID=768535 RepID=A0A4R1L715_9BACT|nr:alpha/beta hydrolase [Acidipila rosea]TCK72843.1 hypothetical protein C7378_2437 [Acidipila rosea]